MLYHIGKIHQICSTSQTKKYKHQYWYVRFTKQNTIHHCCCCFGILLKSMIVRLEKDWVWTSNQHRYQILSWGEVGWELAKLAIFKPGVPLVDWCVSDWYHNSNGKQKNRVAISLKELTVSTNFPRFFLAVSCYSGGYGYGDGVANLDPSEKCCNTSLII